MGAIQEMADFTIYHDDIFEAEIAASRQRLADWYRAMRADGKGKAARSFFVHFQRAKVDLRSMLERDMYFSEQRPGALTELVS